MRYIPAAISDAFSLFDIRAKKETNPFPSELFMCNEIVSVWITDTTTTTATTRIRDHRNEAHMSLLRSIMGACDAEGASHME